MKSPLTPAASTVTRFALAAGAGLLVLVALLPALLGPPWRGVLMDVLAPLCHQLPERSFAIAGVQMGLCHRCTALLLAMVVGLVLPLAPRASFDPRAILAIALLPIALDWGLHVGGIWENTPGSRVMTGAWAGSILGLLIGRTASRDPSAAPPPPPRVMP